MRARIFSYAWVAASIVCFTAAIAGNDAQPLSSSDGRAVCPPAAFVTLESGKIVSVDWVEYSPKQVHSYEVLMQSRIVDARIDLRDDGSAAHSSVVVFAAGEQPGAPNERNLGTGAIYWSDFLVSSVQQAVTRARLLEKPESQIPAASLFADSRGDVLVSRVDDTDWVVAYHNKRYLVLTDAMGCMINATLPDFGVTIERRLDFPRSAYPLWAAYDAPPDRAYSAEQVHIQTQQGPTLAGTLTLPLQQKVSAAAVMITGLSPHERNNGQPPWMPLRDIADVLTRLGIAVLRVDDRGVGQSTGDQTTMTSLAKADDVRSEIAWLRSRRDIDPKRIVLVGYSEGATIAALVAGTDSTIAAIVSLDGTGVSGQQLAQEQTEQRVLHDPAIPPAQRQRKVEKQLAEPLTPHERTFLSIDPLIEIAKVRCPVLIIHGGSDITVPTRSAERLADALRTSGNPNVTVRIIPGVSHSLLPDPLGADSSWAYLPAFETSDQILGLISDWTALQLRVPQDLQGGKKR